ncbi:MAG: DUF3313 family protein [Deltaproteobacteria bacterium]|nr:DUF3313 family protein [Deltaproteobacteria bacterium]
MFVKSLNRLILLASIALLSACGALSLKAAPIPESPQVKTLLRTSGSQLQRDNNGLYPFNHAWRAGYCAEKQEVPVYVTPVDTSRIDQAALSHSRLDQKDLSEIANYAHERLKRAFSETRGRFQLVDKPPSHGRVVEVSVVELTGTEVARNVVGTALGAFIPGGGLVAVRSSGTIGIEGVVKEAHSGRPIVVFADRERGRTAPFSFNDFRVLSHARAAIDDWSEQIVKVCAAEPGAKVPDRLPVTLLPI